MAAERPDGAAAAWSRLTALQDRAAEAYTAVTAADAELRSIAARLVAAERALRRALPAAWPRPGADGAQPSLSDARRDVTQLRDEFARRLAARAEAVSALRRLTAECTAVRAELAGG
jgi:hypothetical protein